MQLTQQENQIAVEMASWINTHLEREGLPASYVTELTPEAFKVLTKKFFDARLEAIKKAGEALKTFAAKEPDKCFEYLETRNDELLKPYL